MTFVIVILIHLGVLGGAIAFIFLVIECIVLLKTLGRHRMRNAPQTGCVLRIAQTNVAQTSNERVSMTCDLYCCLLSQHEALWAFRAAEIKIFKAFALWHCINNIYAMP